MAMALLMKERVLVTNAELVGELEAKGYGERQGNQLLLSPEEALYLKEKRQEFDVQNKSGKSVTYEAMWKTFLKTDKEFEMKYLVFRDLKDRGFCVKTGFKFGSHYRVYARGDKPGKGHAIWLVHVLPEETKVDIIVLSRAIRLAQNVRKKMIYAVVDKESNITYYRFDRITP
ncbi:MAG: tRNA-intron lyase [archaeon]